MLEFLLADVTWENIVLIGSAVGILGGGKVIHGKVTSKTNGRYIKQLCEEKHKVIDERHVEMKDNFKKVFEKLDRIREHQLK